MLYQNWEIFVSIVFYFGTKIIYYYKSVCYIRMFRQDALTSIPERSEINEPQLKWVPKKKHEVLKAKYKCLKKLFQIYDASVIGALPTPCIEYTDDTNTKRRRKRSHRTKTDACAGTTEIYSGDLTQAEYEQSVTTENLKIKQSCSTQIDSKFEKSSVQSHASKSDITSNSEINTESETKCCESSTKCCESINGKCTRYNNIPQNNLPQHVVPYLMNERRKLTRFQCFVQRIFGIRQDYILPNDVYSASDGLQDGRRRRGLRFRRLRRTKKIKSESDIKDMKSSAILSYVQSVQRSCLMDTTPRQCPMVGCKMISYGIINYNDHLNLCHFKDRKYFCHYCHEGFEKEYDKFIHENEHIGLNKLQTNISNITTSRYKIASNSNTQTEPEMKIPDEKLKKIVSFFDKITNSDDVVAEVAKKRSETYLSKDTDSCADSNSSEKRTVSCMNIRRCKCDTNSHTAVTSHQYGSAVTCHIGPNLQYRKQLSLHEDLERRNREGFSKFHSCDGIINRPKKGRELLETSRHRNLCENGRLNVRSVDSSSVTESSYSSVTPVPSELKLTKGKSDESLTCDPSTNIVYYTSLDTVKKPSMEYLMGKFRNYKWEPGTKVIHV